VGSERAQGATEQEALDNIREAIEDYIEVLNELVAS